MHYVFGPVPSRRLGQSLGIDTIPPKTCNWNCVYCQLGRSVPMTNKRREYFPREAILTEVEQALSQHKPGEIDWVTFVGSGEPTLHSELGWLIRQVKQLTQIPIAVITNGSLLYLPKIRKELAPAEVVMPSLDAGTATRYRQINRAHPAVTFDRLVAGLIAFKRSYSGRLWVEVMLVRGLNDSEVALREIAAILDRVQPNEIHLNLPTRPPAETWVRPPDEEGLMRALAILGESAHVVHPAEGSFDLSSCDDVIEAIINIITRHPMRQDELERALSEWAPNQVREILANLEANNQAQSVERYGIRFWSGAPSRFATAV